MNFGRYLGISDGMPGTINEVQEPIAVSVTLDDGRKVTLWGECIGSWAEGAD